MDSFLSIARNGALLLSLVFVYSLLIPYLNRRPQWLSAILTGLLFGAFAILNMLEPLRFANGIMIDPRNVILMLSAMVAGYRSGLLSLLIVASYRFSLGGDGVTSSAMAMLTATCLGLLHHYYRRGQSLRFDR